MSAREKALTGSKSVYTFRLNEQVTVVAKTNTGYYKLLSGDYVHGDYLSTTKTEEQKPATSVPFVPTQPSSGPKNGDTKVENGKTYIWNSDFNEWEQMAEPGTGGKQENPAEWNEIEDWGDWGILGD